MICRPMGGLNDILCQIHRCNLYAIKTNRKLIVDTKDTHYGQPFLDHFESLSDRIILADYQFRPPLEETFPKINCDYRDQIKFTTELGYHFPGHSDSLSLDLNTDYGSRCILYQNHGGGQGSFDIVNFFVVRQPIVVMIRNLLSKLPNGYIGVHIRGTDFIDTEETPTVWAQIDRFSSQILNTDIFLATDSTDILNYFSKKSAKNRVYNFSANIIRDNLPLHMLGKSVMSNEQKNFLNISTIIDLALLAYSNSVHLPVRTKRGYSGFGQLAMFLQMNQLVRDRFFRQ